MTQPKAPLHDGYNYKPEKKQAAKKPVVRTSYQMVEEVVEKDKKVYHTVKKGDYVWALGRKYNVSPFKIIKQNNLKKPYNLNAGQRLYIKTDKVKEVIKVRKEQHIPVQAKSYSLTNNPKLYNQNTAEFRKVKSIPRQDLSRPNKNKNLDFGYHKVRRGENLFRIGRKFGVSVFDLMAYNDIKSPEDLKAGIELKIPVAKKAEAEEPKVENKKATSKPTTTLSFDKIDRDLAKKKGFIYPVKGKIISKFGKKGHGIRNDGIDIAVPMGTPVRASQSGTVRYAEDVSTLGNMILIKHRSGYISAYTHNSKLLVKKGAKVVKGQVIALSGDSGNAKQPMLHFEIRRYGKAINPTRILK
tara:strand:- start:132 stop:1199 length:1068 start_codon:yes stop_codon:yes gene_type:complete